MEAWREKVQDPIRHSVEFFREAWQELKKVHWPTRKETYAATSVVLVVVLLVALYLAIVDYGLTSVIQKMLN